MKGGFVPREIVFPVSAVILKRIDEYRKVLESFSMPRIELIEWKPTPDHNVEVLGNTIDLYRYFDATKQAEFLYSCVKETIEKTIPDEVKYLIKYDEIKSFIDDHFEMPDKNAALLVRFLEKGQGKLSDRARRKEFEGLTDDEVQAIEEKYKEVFQDEVVIFIV